MSKYILWGILIVFALVMFVYYKKSDKPLKNAFLGIFSGAFGITLLYLFGGTVGIVLPVSLYNILFSLILGIPGVIVLIILKLFTGT